MDTAYLLVTLPVQFPKWSESYDLRTISYSFFSVSIGNWHIGVF